METEFLKKPKSDEDWWHLQHEIKVLFDGAPIDEADLFAGRSAEVSRMLDASLARSKHVVLFGERGVGKTSLSNIFWKRFGKSLTSFVVGRIQANPSLTFESLWRDALEEIEATAAQQGRQNLFPGMSDEVFDITPSSLRRHFARASANAIPVIIIDEYDKLIDDEAKELTANLIKEMYDYAVNVTIILVGVAEDIGRLVEDHESLDRALVHIPLGRMTDSELREIITKRTERTPLNFSKDAMWTVITLSMGLPYFTQTLSKFAALNAIKDRRLKVENPDVLVAIDEFIADNEVTFVDAYRTATRSNQTNFFKESLLACALAAAKTDDGFFTANDVLEPYTAITQSKKTISSYDDHLRRFAGEKGGYILKRRGGDRQVQYRFSDPMMQPYVIIKGIQNDMVDEKTKNALLRQEQPSFPTLQ